MAPSPTSTARKPLSCRPGDERLRIGYEHFAFPDRLATPTAGTSELGTFGLSGSIRSFQGQANPQLAVPGTPKPKRPAAWLACGSDSATRRTSSRAAIGLPRQAAARRVHAA